MISIKTEGLIYLCENTRVYIQHKQWLSLAHNTLSDTNSTHHNLIDIIVGLTCHPREPVLLTISFVLLCCWCSWGSLTASQKLNYSVPHLVWNEQMCEKRGKRTRRHLSHLFRLDNESRAGLQRLCSLGHQIISPVEPRDGREKQRSVKIESDAH